ncbi:30S ribosomal protein S17 [Candidatus Saccharibacteria bacterium 49-20]|mgnify:FL=1|nr:MAG: 30S ribosomal protein S17 [Candidatus Saccharibacteria bacterium 49-20]
MAKTLTGIVTSDKADKTIVITVTSRETHPIYGKQYTVNRKYIAHDENNEAHEGDRVVIKETRPISKRKSFTLTEVVERSHGTIELKADVESEEEK